MIRVLIERRIREESGPAYERLQRELRFEALREHGYFTWFKITPAEITGRRLAPAASTS